MSTEVINVRTAELRSRNDIKEISSYHKVNLVYKNGQGVNINGPVKVGDCYHGNISLIARLDQDRIAKLKFLDFTLDVKNNGLVVRERASKLDIYSRKGC